MLPSYTCVKSGESVLQGRLEATLAVVPEAPGLHVAAGKQQIPSRLWIYYVHNPERLDMLCAGHRGAVFTKDRGHFNQLVHVALSRKEMAHARVLGGVLPVQLHEHDAEGHRAPVDTL